MWRIIRPKYCLFSDKINKHAIFAKNRQKYKHHNKCWQPKEVKCGEFFGLSIVCFRTEEINMQFLLKNARNTNIIINIGNQKK